MGVVGCEEELERVARSNRYTDCGGDPPSGSCESSPSTAEEVVLVEEDCCWFAVALSAVDNGRVGEPEGRT